MAAAATRRTGLGSNEADAAGTKKNQYSLNDFNKLPFFQVIDDIDHDSLAYDQAESDHQRGGKDITDELLMFTLAWNLFTLLGLDWKFMHSWINPLKNPDFGPSDLIPTPIIIGMRCHQLLRFQMMICKSIFQGAHLPSIGNTFSKSVPTIRRCKSGEGRTWNNPSGMERGLKSVW